MDYQHQIAKKLKTKLDQAVGENESQTYKYVHNNVERRINEVIKPLGQTPEEIEEFRIQTLLNGYMNIPPADLRNYRLQGL